MQGGAVTLAPQETKTVSVDLTAPFEMFTTGRLDVLLRVSDGQNIVSEEVFQMKGPFKRSAPVEQESAEPTTPDTERTPTP